ncbi:MAG: aminotransferase class V-fold PLP-dependent enzyme [Oscillibacter sp.]|uniref:aminotransferase class V-fold PLP-dependent enzyme n=1 Tax=uncultured Oscillibacter sp. TaxID=876091 RepID=UPI0021741B42|nr:aminotransferase class V-fold PLP-dependent enzyme [uncultured Oscillibacter sp.]MCI9643268.1 aminotransferase class V-fold PLP-dependent enzyme [Oscillibacter sp.]
MIYFDSAATSFQKPASVAAAMWEALASMSSPGRGGYPAAARAADTAFQCRSELAELFGLKNPEQVVFTFNATHALNIAIKSLVRPGGKVVVSGYEHNAVTRPLEVLGADISVAAAPLFQPGAVAEAFSRLVRPGLDAVICSHVSNVFGFIQPVGEIAAICRNRGVPFIIDASQSAGVLPLDMEALGAAFIAMPGHKGLYGPQGTGVLLCREDVPARPLLEGGTGSQSIQQRMPDFLPDRLEAGTLNMPGIAGLLAGVRYVRRGGLDKILAHEKHLTQLALQGLEAMPGLRTFVSPGLRDQTGVLSLTAEGTDVETIGSALAERGIAVRSGIHCAPYAHRTAGTLDTGTVRISFSDFNTPEEVARLLRAVHGVLGRAF